MKISMIAAIGVNNELGHGNELIWRIPADMKRFKEKTAGHPVIMGRKTYESIGRLLPNRSNIIISRDESFVIPNLIGDPESSINSIGHVVNSIEQAIEKAKEIEETRQRPRSGGQREIFIIGGAQIYALGLPLVDKLYITKINSQNPVADAFFPDYSEFSKVVFQESHNDDGLEYEFLELER